MNGSFGSVVTQGVCLPRNLQKRQKKLIFMPTALFPYEIIRVKTWFLKLVWGEVGGGDSVLVNTFLMLHCQLLKATICCCLLKYINLHANLKKKTVIDCIQPRSGSLSASSGTKCFGHAAKSSDENEVSPW